MFYKSKEAGKKISSQNMKKLQSIHEAVVGLGATCIGSFYEAHRESGRMVEAALPLTTSHDSLRQHIRKALYTAHQIGESNWNGPYVSDVFPEHVVYNHEGQTYRRKYTVAQGAAGSDPTVTLGAAKKCHVAYMDSQESDASKESMRILMDAPLDTEDDVEGYALLSEKSVPSTLEEGEVAVQEGVVISLAREAGKDKPITIPIKLIAPGWGSSAYYSTEVLKRDGPTVFKKGTHMMWNHQTATEEAERPEGDLSDLAAVLVESAHWEEAGAKGPGLYARAKVFSDYAQQVEEKGAHIGVSINAVIKTHEGEAEGKSGRIADKFLHAYSTDFVTKPGAGGAPIVPALESSRGPMSEQEQTMTDAEIKALQDSEKAAKESARILAEENTRLKEGQNRVLAMATVGSVLTEAGIMFKPKALELVCQSPKMVKEGDTEKVDPAWVKTVVEALSDDDAGVHGMGTVRSRETVGGDKFTEAEEKEFKETMKEMGVPEAGLQVALMAGR